MTMESESAMEGMRGPFAERRREAEQRWANRSESVLRQMMPMLDVESFCSCWSRFFLRAFWGAKTSDE